MCQKNKIPLCFTKIDFNFFFIRYVKQKFCYFQMKAEIISTIIENSIDTFDDDTPLLQISNCVQDTFTKMWKKELKKLTKLKDMRQLVIRYDLRDEKSRLIKAQSKEILKNRLQCCVV